MMLCIITELWDWKQLNPIKKHCVKLFTISAAYKEVVEATPSQSWKMFQQYHPGYC